MSATRPQTKRRAQALLEPLDRRRRGVGGEHDLVAGLVEGVEGVEELLLGALLAGEDVDVVEEQQWIER